MDLLLEKILERKCQLPVVSIVYEKPGARQNSCENVVRKVTRAQISILESRRAMARAAIAEIMGRRYSE